MKVIRYMRFLLMFVFLLLIFLPYSYLTHPFPQTSGTLYFPQLDAPVEIRRDEMGVPHIYASTDHDLFFAQGVVHAQDRLWQMDIQRRGGLGRLGEWGMGSTEADDMVRRAGISQMAERKWEALDKDSQMLLEAYSAGINATVASLSVLPLEYQWEGVEWEAWEPVHSLVWLEMVQWCESQDWEPLLLGKLVDKVGEETATLLWGGRSIEKANNIPNVDIKDLEALRAIYAPSEGYLSCGLGGGGVRSWVVAGERTRTGMPLLASSSSLGSGIPSAWYLVGLHAPEFEVVGASLPGVPAVVMGHNADLAWGWKGQMSGGFEAFVALNQATNREEFLAGLRLWDGVASQVVYADREGNIGMIGVGEAFGDELPQRWNPDEGFLVGLETVDSFQARRLEMLLAQEEPILVADLVVMQDVYSLLAEKLVPLVVALPTDDIVVQRAQEQLQAWNFEMEGQLPGAGIYAVLRDTLWHELLQDEFGEDEEGKDLLNAYLSYNSNHAMVLERLLDQPEHALWDDIMTAKEEKRDAILLRALLRTDDWLGRRFGDVPHEWFWNRLHTLTLAHPLAADSPWQPLLSREVALGGDESTLYRTSLAFGEVYAVRSMPTYRQVIDVGNWEASRMGLSTGQSGHLFHAHYDDMLDEWENGNLWPMYWHDEQTEAVSEEQVLYLMP